MSQFGKTSWENLKQICFFVTGKNGKRRNMMGKECPWCAEELRNKSNYYQHRVLIHHFGSFQCPMCRLKYHFAKDVVEHMKKKNHSGPVHCSKCKNDFAREEIEFHHVMCGAEPEPIVAQDPGQAGHSSFNVPDIKAIIDKMDDGIEQLALNNLHKLAQTKPAPVVTQEPSRKHECSVCHTTLTSVDILKRHIKLYRHMAGIDVREAKRIISSLSLSSLDFGDHLVVTRSEFDVTISGEPYVALMLLYNIKSGKYMARIWNQTVAVGWALKDHELHEACRTHFGQGRPCIGHPSRSRNDIDSPSEDFLVSQTPIPRIISKNCHKFLGKYYNDRPSCPECQKLSNLEATDNVKNVWEDPIRTEGEHGENEDMKKEYFEDDWAKNSIELFESGKEILNKEKTKYDQLPKDIMPIPPFTYAQLIVQSLTSGHNYLGIPVPKIFSFISQKYPFYKMEDGSWQNSIRQVLLMNEGFEKVQRSSDDSVDCWRMKDGFNFEDQISKDALLGKKDTLLSNPQVDEFSWPNLKTVRVTDQEGDQDDPEGDCTQNSTELYEPGEGISNTDHIKKLPKALMQEVNKQTGSPTGNVAGPLHKSQEDKQPFSYAQLIVQALITEKGSLGLPLSKIYSFICEKYPFYEMEDSKRWQNSIRHNLSLDERFEKVSNPHGNGSLWRIKGTKAQSSKDDSVDCWRMKQRGMGKACPWCDKVIMNSTFYYQHRVFAHHFGLFQCPMCPFKCHFAKDVTDHMKEETHSGSVNCSKCKKDFALEEIESHYVMCATGCATCSKTFSSRSNFTYHLKYAHKEEGDFDKEESKCCERCGKQFKNGLYLYQHKRKVHEGKERTNKPKKCSICGLIFKNARVLHAHRVKVHFREENERQCQKCGLKVPTTAALKIHLRSHEAPQHKCSFCGKMFRKRIDLVGHERAHKGEKPFPCSLCSAGFTLKRNLGQHMKGAHKILGPKGGQAGWMHGKKEKQNSC